MDSLWLSSEQQLSLLKNNENNGEVVRNFASDVIAGIAINRQIVNLLTKHHKQERISV
jgi:hypothetical protein